MKKSPMEYFAVVALIVVVALLSLNILNLLATHVGTTHHGIVVEEICNAPSQSYVVINYNGTPHSYQTTYTKCLEFLFKHGKGVTITDDAWYNEIAAYRFD